MARRHETSILDDLVKTKLPLETLSDDFKKPVCPKCSSEKVGRKQGEWATAFHCESCGHLWPAGMARGRPDPYEVLPDPRATFSPPEDDAPEQDWTPDYRNPLKNYDYE